MRTAVPVCICLQRIYPYLLKRWQNKCGQLLCLVGTPWPWLLPLFAKGTTFEFCLVCGLLVLSGGEVGGHQHPCCSDRGRGENQEKG